MYTCFVVVSPRLAESRRNDGILIRRTTRRMFYHQEDITLKTGIVLEKGTGAFVLMRAVGVSDKFFTRAKEFVPERCVGVGTAAPVGRSSRGSCNVFLVSIAAVYYVIPVCTFIRFSCFFIPGIEC